MTNAIFQSNDKSVTISDDNAKQQRISRTRILVLKWIYENDEGIWFAFMGKSRDSNLEYDSSGGGKIDTQTIFVQFGNIVWRLDIEYIGRMARYWSLRTAFVLHFEWLVFANDDSLVNEARSVGRHLLIARVYGSVIIECSRVRGSAGCGSNFLCFIAMRWWGSKSSIP